MIYGLLSRFMHVASSYRRDRIRRKPLNLDDLRKFRTALEAANRIANDWLSSSRGLTSTRPVMFCSQCCLLLRQSPLLRRKYVRSLSLNEHMECKCVSYPDCGPVISESHRMLIRERDSHHKSKNKNWKQSTRLGKVEAISGLRMYFCFLFGSIQHTKGCR